MRLGRMGRGGEWKRLCELWRSRGATTGEQDLESAGTFPYCAQFVQILGQLTACIHGLAPHI